MNNNHHKNRIILLLDLDCFYAQCEMIRLNIDETQPVCLLQWNSALAINYPARRLYKFKRGVSFEEIQSVSHGKCIALHLPVISLPQNQQSHGGYDTTTAAAAADEDVLNNSTYNNSNNNIIETLYNQEYNQPQHIKEQLFHQEKNVMKTCRQGKASLERYRLASTYIFETIQNSLQDQQRHYNRTKKKQKRGNDSTNAAEADSGEENDYYILEKASVDELYLDVTKICYDFDIEHVWQDDDIIRNTVTSNHGVNQQAAATTTTTKPSIEKMALDETVIFAQHKIQTTFLTTSTTTTTTTRNHSNPPNDNHKDDDYNYDNNSNISNEEVKLIKALTRGCIIARGIRKAVHDKLGFTLSAGISINKLVSKLSASYGKPNGQAIVFPDAIPYLMEETPIRKARNFGGKIGKEIQRLLPPEETTLTSIANYLSMNELTKALGNNHATAKMVFDACRGIDYEPVKETKGALSKSITAFKSFGPTKIGHLGKWITLLATDVFKRVHADSIRNHRFPKICTIQYYYRRETGEYGLFVIIYLVLVH